MNKDKLITKLQEAGFKDIVKYDRNGRATHWELGMAIDSIYEKDN